MQKTKDPSTFSEYIKKFDELKTVFDSLPDGIVAILDADMNIATANRAISEMLQLPLKNIIGKKATKIFKKNIPGLLEVLKETIKTKLNLKFSLLEVNIWILNEIWMNLFKACCREIRRR